jgi:hypothetical protein
MQNKWESLIGEGYKIEDLGRPAIFLLPTKKLRQKIDDANIEEDLHRFLTENFGSYTSLLIPTFGFWRDQKKAVIFDECRQYEVSFVGKERIPVLLKKLAQIAIIIQEECIYIKAGQYSGLVYPTQKSSL